MFSSAGTAMLKLPGDAPQRESEAGSHTGRAKPTPLVSSQAADQRLSVNREGACIEAHESNCNIPQFPQLNQSRAPWA